MARVVDLTGENLTRQRRKERNYGTKTDLSSTTVERGSTHWAEGSNVNIDGFLGVAGTATVSGTLRVSGLLDVTGTLNASGQINLSGSTGITGPLNVTGTTTIGGNTNITGELNVTGPTTLDGILDIGGDTTISGTLDIEGDTTVAADFEITTGGLFRSGVTKIEPTGKATFGEVVIDPASPRMIQSPSGWLTANGTDSIGLSSSNTSSVNLNGTYADLNYAGTSRVIARDGAIDLNAPKTWVNGELEATGISRFPRIFVGSGFGTEISPTRLKIGSLPTTTTATSNVYCDSNGYFYRVVT